jgi:uncharacterized protein (TIGR02996 family)
VTTEDDFQAALDANPADWQTRLVFADWLAERGDPRAVGYRVLGQLRVAPKRSQLEGPDGKPLGPCQFVFANGANKNEQAQKNSGGCMLPSGWYKKLDRRDRINSRWWRFYSSRREAEDIAANAFARLTKATQTRYMKLAPLLTEPTPEPKPKRKRPSAQD